MPAKRSVSTSVKDAASLDAASAAIEKAKATLARLLHAEAVSDISVEEYSFDAAADEWVITLGFTRKFSPRPVNVFGDTLADAPIREYKVLRLKNGNPIAMLNHAA